MITKNNLNGSYWPTWDIILGILIITSIVVFMRFVPKIMPNPYGSRLSSLIALSLCVLPFMVLTTYSLYRCRKRGLRPLYPSITPSQLLKEIPLSLWYAFLISAFVSTIIAMLAYIFKIDKPDNSFVESLSLAPNGMLVVGLIILAVVIGPIAEEMFFRGFLYNVFKMRLSLKSAAILQAALFALYHQYELSGRIGVFFVGVAFAIIYERRNTLLSPTLVHTTMNLVKVFPVIVLICHDFHVPSKDWNEAMKNPDWFDANPIEEVKRQENGMDQWQYAIDTWGSKGSKQWKEEINAFNAVCTYHPDDREACTKAKLGIVTVYYLYLRDYRRAVIEADKLISQYPENRRKVASALCKEGWAYYMLKDYERSRASFMRVINNFSEYEVSYESAKKGIGRLNR